MQLPATLLGSKLASFCAPSILRVHAARREARVHIQERVTARSPHCFRLAFGVSNMRTPRRRQFNAFERLRTIRAYPKPTTIGQSGSYMHLLVVILEYCLGLIRKPTPQPEPVRREGHHSRRHNSRLPEAAPVAGPGNNAAPFHEQPLDRWMTPLPMAETFDNRPQVRSRQFHASSDSTSLRQRITGGSPAPETPNDCHGESAQGRPGNG